MMSNKKRKELIFKISYGNYPNYFLGFKKNKRKIIRHIDRDLVIKIIRENPGCTARFIAEKIDFYPCQVRPVIKTLEKYRLIKYKLSSENKGEKNIFLRNEDYKNEYY